MSKPAPVLCIPLRHEKPYISNGGGSEFCERYLDVEKFEPTVLNAFKASTVSPSTPRRRGPSPSPARAEQPPLRAPTNTKDC